MRRSNALSAIALFQPFEALLVSLNRWLGPQIFCSQASEVDIQFPWYLHIQNSRGFEMNFKGCCMNFLVALKFCSIVAMQLESQSIGELIEMPVENSFSAVLHLVDMSLPMWKFISPSRSELTDWSLPGQTGQQLCAVAVGWIASGWSWCARSFTFLVVYFIVFLSSCWFFFY